MSCLSRGRGYCFVLSRLAYILDAGIQSEVTAMATTTEILTAEEYARLPDSGVPTELERGRIVTMNVPNFPHGRICVRIGKLLATYVDDRDPCGNCFHDLTFRPVISLTWTARCSAAER